jgi:hypothetical protein
MLVGKYAFSDLRNMKSFLLEAIAQGKPIAW